MKEWLRYSYSYPCRSCGTPAESGTRVGRVPGSRRVAIRVPSLVLGTLPCPVCTDWPGTGSTMYREYT
eukprot:scaffold584011_cov36-Prasinocladus_malaysianus.AAC.1